MAIIDYTRVFQPVFLVRVDGESAGDLVDLMSTIKISESERANLTVEIDMHATAFGLQAEDGGLAETPFDFGNTIIDDPRVQPGAEWEIRWGYFDDMSPIVAVSVTHFKPDFPPNGLVTMKLFLSSRGARINRDTRSMNHGRVQTSDIARRIAERYGMRVDVEDSDDARSRAYVQPSNMTDMEYLQRLARRIRWVCYVEGNTLHYHPPRLDEAPRLELAYYAGDPTATLQHFTPETKEVHRQRTRAQGSSDADAGEGGSDTAEDSEQNSLGRVVVVDTRTGDYWSQAREEPIAVSEPTAETDARVRNRIAQARQRDMLERVNKATAVAIGTPQLRRDTNVTVLGVGRHLSGVWHIRECSHELAGNGSYTVSMQLRRGAANDAARCREGTESGTKTVTDKDVEWTTDGARLRAEQEERQANCRRTRGNDQEAQGESGESNGLVVVDTRTRDVWQRPPVRDVDGGLERAR